MQLVQIQSKYVDNANYSNLYYFQNRHYIRFMPFVDKNKQNTEAQNQVRHNKYPEVKQQTAKTWVGTHNE